MLLTWVASLLLLGSSVSPQGQLTLELAGESLEVVEKEAYLLPVSPGLPVIDPDKLEKLLLKVERRVYQEPKNATTDEAGKLVAERNGRQLDRFALEQALYQGMYEGAGAKIDVPVQLILPRVDRQLLTQLAEKRIGTYTTYFNTNNRNRVNNIALSAKSLHNYVVFPGEVFSFNKVVGMRTKEKGYKEAPVIVRGEISEGVGGGICQVSSTLFNAVDRAGLHIVQRYSHSRQVPYVPPGRDATVSWYGPDFKFQNKYAYPILIRTYSKFGQVSVTIHSFNEIEYDPRVVPGMFTELYEVDVQDLVNEKNTPPSP
ncbi:UNVERIFIED_CONTAM: vancomycin resistance protein YoaR [Brevibacillus sp. OAP136]